MVIPGLHSVISSEIVTTAACCRVAGAVYQKIHEAFPDTPAEGWRTSRFARDICRPVFAVRHCVTAQVRTELPVSSIPPDNGRRS